VPNNTFYGKYLIRHFLCKSVDIFSEIWASVVLRAQAVMVELDVRKQERLLQRVKVNKVVIVAIVASSRAREPNREKKKKAKGKSFLFKDLSELKYCIVSVTVSIARYNTPTKIPLTPTKKMRNKITNQKTNVLCV